MAIQAPVKPNMPPDVDDDDEPLVFRRSSTTSRQSQLNTESKKCSSQRNDGQTARQVSNARSPNGLNSSNQKNKNDSSTVAPPRRSPLASPNASTSSTKASPLRSPAASQNALPASVKASSSKPPVRNSKADDLSKPSLKAQTSNATKIGCNSTKHHSESDSKVYDSDDDKVLSSKIKVNTNHVKKVSGSPSPMLSDGESDDEKPLSSRLTLKSTPGKSGSKHNENFEKKPLAMKTPKVDSTSRGSSTISSKRPLDKVAGSSSQSSAKMAKLSDSMKMKHVLVKAEVKEEDEDDDYLPISQRIKKAMGSDKKANGKEKAMKPVHSSFKKTIKKTNKGNKDSGYSKSSSMPPNWSDGQKKWTTLVHNGVIFPPPYKPHGVKMLYKGRQVDLTPEQEEVATMYAVMRDTDYMEKPKFRENFWADWRKILGKNHIIQSLEDCDFTPIYEWAQEEKEKKKQMSKEEKQALKEAKMKEEEKYMWAIVDGVKEKVGNFRVEPPGLFRGRGEHPKMGKLKRRIHPGDITINIGKDAPIPECPIPGQSWGEIRHDNTVTWLAFWQNPINSKEFKYVFLAASSSLKGQSDKEKYEKARKLKEYIKDIRVNYTRDFTSKDVTKRQIAVATYLIDKLALRAGNEKDDDEADTVGCCTLKVENVTPEPPKTLKFDFLGKDSIRYEKDVEVEPAVYNAIVQFRAGKDGGEDLFDKLDTNKLNAHLKELMPGLTAKVFRTFNASFTLDDKLANETREGDVAEKVLIYNQANKEVAIICNHQRTVSKSHGAQIQRLNEKIEELKVVMKDLENDYARAKKGKPLKSSDGKPKRNLSPEAIQKKIAQTKTKIEKFEMQKDAKEDLKTVALGTSKINYCDPRITVAWCKRHEVPIEKIFQKALLAKFAWAMDTDPDFRF